MHDAKKHSIVLYSLVIGAIYTLSFSSCLSEPDRDCPPEYSISLSVKDKNYFNVAEVSEIQPKDESQPFRAYIGNISYQLQNLETKEIVVELTPSTVGSDDQLYVIDATNIPEGKYLLTTLGNTSESPLLREALIPLHDNNQEQFDTYLAHDTITLSKTTPEHFVAMNRTKGLLAILVENAPDSLARVDEQINHVVQFVDRFEILSGDISVNKSFTQTSFPSATLTTLLAPTPTGKKSTLVLSLFAKNKSIPYAILPNLEFSIKRNEISAVKLNFTPSGIEIWMYMYGNWQKLHNLDITF